MNIPLQGPRSRPDLFCERGAGLADAAQRDLLEYFAPPRAEAAVLALAAAIAPAAAPNAPVAVEDEAAVEDKAAAEGGAAVEDEAAVEDGAVAWHDQILAWPDDTQDDETSYRESESGDEIASCDPAATHSEVLALEEVSRANLCRLETTLNWLQSEVEACRLPPAAPLRPIPGLPVVAPIIDRSTLDRTLHRAPPLPAWLRETPSEPRIAPPPRGGVAWPRAVKFVIACAIAAPLSYYFAVTTSPLPKHLVEVVGAASPDSPAVHPAELRHRLRSSKAAPESAPEARTLAPERIVEAPALLEPVSVETRASPELPSVAAPVIPAPAVSGQAVRAEAPQLEAPRAEAAKAEIVSGPPATVAAEDKEAPAPPAVAQASAPAPATAIPQDVKLLVEQGRQFFDVGDLIAARILFLRAANAGDATAAVAMGATYDPVVLAERGVRGPAADLDKARHWYEKAKAMGSQEGPRRLEMLANR
jgi:hypothetical protein